MRYFFICILSVFVFSFINGFVSNAYNYSLPAPYNGDTINLNNYQGKKILIVNIATGSDKISQLAALEQLFQEHADSLVIIVVPSNSFGNEQLTDSSLLEYTEVNYNNSFILSGKIDVAGGEIHPLFVWLSKKTLNGVLDNPVIEDFQKFLIDQNGNVIGFFSAKVDPLSAEMEDAIKGL